MTDQPDRFMQFPPNERVYLRFTNIAKVRMLASVLRDVMPNFEDSDDYGIPSQEYKSVKTTVYQWIENLEKMVAVEMGHEDV